MAANGRYPTITAVALLLVAVAIWGYWMWPFSSFDTQELRQVEGIDVQVTSLRVTGSILRVGCRVTNRGEQTAQQVVLTARVKNPRGEVLGVNPLASVSDVQPGASCETEIPIPGSGNFRQCHAEVEATLVRWD